MYDPFDRYCEKKTTKMCNVLNNVIYVQQYVSVVKIVINIPQFINININIININIIVIINIINIKINIVILTSSSSSTYKVSWGDFLKPF